MDIFIGGFSALEYWNHFDRRQSINLCRQLPAAFSAVHMGDVKGLNFDKYGILSRPVEIIVADPPSRPQIKLAKGTVWQAPSGTRSFARVEIGLYVARPEACLLQVAMRLTDADLILLANSVTSCYSGPTCSDSQNLSTSLTSVKKISNYLDFATGMPGYRKIKKIMPYVADFAASPMETNLMLLLCLPPRYGGFGVPVPLLNPSVQNLLFASKEHTRPLHPDLYWPQEKLALEYDSKEFHSGYESRELDSLRRSRFESTSIHVVSVTKSQIFSLSKFNLLANAIRKAFGLKRLHNEPKFANKQIELRRKIFGQNILQC